MQSRAYITFVIFGACLMSIKLIGPTVKSHRSPPLPILFFFFFSFLFIFSNGGVAGVFIFRFGVKLVSWFFEGPGFPLTKSRIRFLSH